MRILNKNQLGIKSLKLFSCFITIILTLLLTGCPWFDGNNDNDETPPQEVSTAPSAFFSISAVSGKAPFTVTFTDSSQNGSANITQWQWDFGDGSESSAQNPDHIFEIAGTYDISLTVTSADGSDSASQLGAIVVEPADTQITITVVDSRGLAVEGVTATSETFTIESQSYNEKKQLSLSVRSAESQGVFRLSKEGYTDNLVYAEHTKFSNTVAATLLKRTPAIEFNGFFGGEIIGIDGASVTILPESLIKPDGSVVTGTVELYMTPVDTSDPIKSKAFPGSFYGLPDADQIPIGQDPQQQLFSYGVVEYAFFADGEELQLKDGMQAELKLPLYNTTNIFGEDLVIGGIIPLWTLNETTGIWEQQGEGSIIANPIAASGFSLKASTSHFTWFNTDSWSLSATGSLSSPNGSGTAGNIENRGSCVMTITLVGAEIGSYLRFGLNNFFGRPMSNLSQYLLYDGTPIMTNIPQGTNIEASVDQGRSSASKIIRCYDETGEDELILTEVEPEFVDWNLQAEPVFSRSSNNDLYEILENEILIGGHFVGDDSVEIETTLVGAEVLSLPDGQFFSAPFKPTDTSPTEITATLSNEAGTVELISSVDYVESHSPVLEYFHVQPSDFSLEYYWEVKGADSASIYYLGEDANALGIAIFRIEDMEAGFIINSQLVGQTGFLKIVMQNQYGNTVKIARLAELFCIPESENINCLL